MSKGYVVALLKLTNKEHFVNDYATKVPAIIEEFGGRIVARTPNAHFREGKEFSLHVVVEFDDFEKGKEMMNSEKFKTPEEIVAYREKLKKFNYEKYKYNSKLSSSNDWVFTR